MLKQHPQKIRFLVSLRRRNKNEQVKLNSSSMWHQVAPIRWLLRHRRNVMLCKERSQWEIKPTGEGSASEKQAQKRPSPAAGQWKQKRGTRCKSDLSLDTDQALAYWYNIRPNWVVPCISPTSLVLLGWTLEILQLIYLKNAQTFTALDPGLVAKGTRATRSVPLPSLGSISPRKQVNHLPV